MRHPAKRGSFLAKFVVKDLQARPLSIRKWQQSTLHELNGLSSGIESIAPVDHLSRAFWTWDHQTDPFSFGERSSATSSLLIERALLGHPPTQVRCGSPWLQPFEHEEMNHLWLFHITPKRICIRLKFDGRLSRKIIEGRKTASRKMRGMGICSVYLLFTRSKLQQGSRFGVSTNLLIAYNSTFSSLKIVHPR
jgi:hypothetical protein